MQYAATILLKRKKQSKSFVLREKVSRNNLCNSSQFNRPFNFSLSVAHSLALLLLSICHRNWRIVFAYGKLSYRNLLLKRFVFCGEAEHDKMFLQFSIILDSIRLFSLTRCIFHCMLIIIVFKHQFHDLQSSSR